MFGIDTFPLHSNYFQSVNFFQSVPVAATAGRVQAAAAGPDFDPRLAGFKERAQTTTTVVRSTIAAIRKNVLPTGDFST